MDKNEFFREATLKICGNLEIEEAMFSTLQFLRQVMPVSWMALEYYDKNLKSMRTIATATQAEGKGVDLLTPLTAEAQKGAERRFRTDYRKVRLVRNPKTKKLVQEMKIFHGVEPTSILLLPLESGGRLLGALPLITEGDERFSQKHADLISLLREPFALALSNILKHRSELKLYDRDFFWEVTKRICGNLEIEDGLRACIEYLAQHMPADVIYLARHERDLGAMRIVAQASKGKGERMNLLIPLLGQAKKVMAQARQAWLDRKSVV